MMRHFKNCGLQSVYFISFALAPSAFAESSLVVVNAPPAQIVSSSAPVALPTQNTAKADWVARDLVNVKTAPLSDYKNYEFLFVPGFLYDVYVLPKKNQMLRKMRAGQYFDQMNEAMLAAGARSSIAEIDSEDSIFDNAKDLAAILEQKKGPVVLVSHSKGGLELLETLIENPHLRRKVALWIVLQSPFYGSQIADQAFPQYLLREAAKRLLEYWDGSLDSFAELQSKVRKAYMEDRRGRIEQLAADVRIVSVATWISGVGAENGPGIPALLPLEKLMRHGGAQLNDGLVSLESAHLPGTRLIKIAGIDHGDAVMPLPGRRVDRVSLLRVILNEYHAQLKDASTSP